MDVKRRDDIDHAPVGASEIAPAGIAGSLTVFLFVLVGLGLYFVLTSW